MTVFYVDDDPDDLELFKAALEEINSAIKLVTFASCPEVIKELQSTTVLPAYIFLDINLTPENGKICLARIKKDDRLKNIPVYMLSTAKNPSEVLECFKWGAQDYIQKKQNFKSLIQELKRLFNSDKK